jgi:hypothetical protein
MVVNSEEEEEDRSSEEHVAEQQEEAIGTPGHIVQRQGELELRPDSDFFRDFKDFLDDSDMKYTA